jgi:2'-5' RNA ligase
VIEMADQPYFQGFEPMLKPVVNPWTRKKRRFFFALRPDDIAAEVAMGAARKLRHAHGLTGYSLKRENLHVSLLLLLECDEPPHDLAEIASAAVQAIQARPFDIVFDMALSFPQKGGHCLVLGDTRGAAGIYDLQRRFVMRFSPRNRVGSMTPHMTLMYPSQFVEKQPIDPVRWRANEFVLIDSWQGLGRHDIVGRWPLR